MAIDLDEKEGHSPLDPGEKTGFIPQHLVTKRDLKEEVQEKILIVVRCLKRMRPNVFSKGFCRTLHAKLFSLIWK